MKKGLNLLIILLIIGVVGLGVYLFLFNVRIKEIKLNKTDINLHIDERDIIIASIIPGNAWDKTIFWQSLDENVATVDNNGVVTAINPGETSIVVSSKDGDVTSLCRVKVYIIEVEKIELSTNNLELTVGDKQVLKANVLPTNATYPNITYQSTDSNVVSVDAVGNLEAKNPGSVEIIVTDEKKQTESRCQITVKPKIIEVTSISLSETTITLEKSQTKTLNATIAPDNASNKTITWSSSDTNIATVTDGKITPKKKGTITITAKSNNGKTATAKVTINNNTYNKTAIFFGDSITYGKDGNYSWANYIGEKYDLKKTTNAGISGGVISDTREDKWIEDVVRKYKVKSYDYVIMHGGINDISRRTAMGSYKAKDFSGNYDTKTFIGGLEHYIYTVKKQWPNAKIGYIVNYSTPLAESVYAYENAYYSKIKEVLKKWGVSYFDLYSGKAPNGKKYSDLLKVNTKTYLSDGVHLTREGYKLISPDIYNWMNNL